MLKKQSILFILALVLSQSTFGLLDKEDFNIVNGKKYKRSLVFSPLASFFLPGFGQYLEGQTNWGLGYTSTWGAGLVIHKISKGPSQISTDALYGSPKILGMSLMGTAGMISAYHDFHTGIRTHKEDFDFIKKEDSIKDILAAPFDLSYLSDMRITLPLLGVAALVTYQISATEGVPSYQHSFGQRATNVFGLSYLAGTGEEAAFRGYLFPLIHSSVDRNFWLSNSIQAVVFGALHINKENPFPLIQTALGAYLGWLSKEEGYSILPGTFLHHWWDVIAFSSILLRPDAKFTRPVGLELINVRF